MDSQRIARLEAVFAARTSPGDDNPYLNCADGELLELATAVTADAQAHPENYLDRSGVALLEQITKLNRGHAPLGETNHATK